MDGLFNSGIRDFCGDESAISKLSNHFSKDYSLKQEGLNQNTLQVTQQSVPATFNINELFKNMIENEKKISSNDTRKITSDVIMESNSNSLIGPSLQDKFTPLNNAEYITPVYFSIPQPRYCAPDYSLVANEWARNELSQFDNSIITEDDLKALLQSDETKPYEIRFSDIVRNMTLEDESQEMHLSNDNLKQENDDFLYDLDRDLKNMREKLIMEEGSVELWPQLNNNYRNIAKEFVFITNNRYADALKATTDNQDENIEALIKKGISLYGEGYFTEAMLIFEAVVQVKPGSETGWHYLALSLSENEQDYRAMLACRKCLELNKGDLEILLSLARVHCNDMNIISTITCLEQWLLANPKYCDLATVGQEAANDIKDYDESMWESIFEDAFESSGKFGIIEQQLQSAKERNGSSIDGDVEIALGTLYHVIQDYTKSTLHFENAATVATSNALLWNKLGTSYCNSGNFDKAINTYQRALELAPGFVRAECNLGVSFYNMGKYSDAIKHALKAHKLQHTTSFNGAQPAFNSTEMSGTVVETDPIWTLIRMSCFKMDRPDLDLVVFSRDVDTLCKEFDV